MVVCTLCSCYPWPVLGLPPVWYKSAPYRSRAVIDPRGVLKDFGVTLPKDTDIRVWDSTAEIRYLVIPMRPAGTEGWSEEKLAELVTRDSMIGTGLREAVGNMNGAQDMGGVHGFGPVEPEPNEPVFHADWEKRAFALTLAMAMPGQWNIDMSRFARENRDPAEYLSMSYYQIWFAALETMLKERALVGDDEIAAGQSLHPAKPVPRVLSPEDVLKVLHRGGPTERATNSKPAFKAGDSVRAKNINPVDAHAAAALCARARRHGRARDRLSCISRQQRARLGREPAMALHRALCRPRIVGRRRRPERDGLGRRLGAVFGESMIDQAAAARATQEVPSIPRDADGPVFREPWEAQAFAMTLALHERGVFTWPEWAAALAAEIKRAQAAGDPDTGETYYSHWLAALEKLVAEKGVDQHRHAASLSRCLGPRLRPHPARQADRAKGRGFRLTIVKPPPSARSPCSR